VGQALDQSFPFLKKEQLHSQLEQLDAVCLFGSSDDSLLSWVEQSKERALIFLEEDEHLFLKAKSGALSDHPQVRILYYSKENLELFKQIAWEFVFLRWGYFVLEGGCPERAQECFALLEQYHLRVDLLASEYQDRGLKVLSNVFSNLSLVRQSKRGSSLEGSCRGMTAVVCGAGPSLNKVAPLLSQLQNQLLIIAGGSAVKALNAQGITPHLIAAIDPDPSYPRFLEQESFETPFFYQSRFNHDLLYRSQGPKVWMPSQSLIPLESYLLSECGLYSEPFDAGWTVANFCTSLAAHLGVERIIFTGVDFVCGKEAVYASNLHSSEHQECLIEWQKGIYTRKDWLMSADWTRSFVRNHPHIQWMNLSSAPIDLLGVPEISFEHLLKLDLPPETDLFAKVHALIEEADSVAISPAKVDQVRAQMRCSFETCFQLSQKLLHLWEQAYPASPLEDPHYMLIQHDFEQEICYEKCLAPLWDVWKYSILRTEFHPLARSLHRLLFFQSVLETHLSYLRS